MNQERVLLYKKNYAYFVWNFSPIQAEVTHCKYVHKVLSIFIHNLAISIRTRLLGHTVSIFERWKKWPLRYTVIFTKPPCVLFEPQKNVDPDSNPLRMRIPPAPQRGGFGKGIISPLSYYWIYNTSKYRCLFYHTTNRIPM